MCFSFMFIQATDQHIVGLGLNYYLLERKKINNTRCVLFNRNKYTALMNIIL